RRVCPSSTHGVDRLDDHPNLDFGAQHVRYGFGVQPKSDRLLGGELMVGFYSGGRSWGAGVVCRRSRSGEVWAFRVARAGGAPACLFVPFALGTQVLRVGALGGRVAWLAGVGAPRPPLRLGVGGQACFVFRRFPDAGLARAPAASAAWVMAPLPFPPGVVAVAGSSRLPPGGAQLVARVALALEASGFSLAVGCCAGADQVALSAVSAVRVLCAFGPGGAGAGPASAVRAVLAAQVSGVPVAWWAGGPPSVPLKARLARRTAAVVAQASAGCVVFFGSPVSRGALLAAELAAARGLPVIAFPVGFPASELPPLWAGRWGRRVLACGLRPRAGFQRNCACGCNCI
ncbi:MAG: hypothetical protein ACREYE_10965, partial [Gammaproteobacteria bacterium]